MTNARCSSYDLSIPEGQGAHPFNRRLVISFWCQNCWLTVPEHWRIDAFDLWCWRRLLRVPWTARRFNQSILKEIVLNIHWKDCCWSSNTLATWCKELIYWKRPWKAEGRRRRGPQEDEMVECHHQLNGHEFEQAPGDSERQGSLVCCSPWGHKELDMTEQLNSWCQMIN